MSSSSSGSAPSWQASTYASLATKGTHHLTKIYPPDDQHHWILHATPLNSWIHSRTISIINTFTHKIGYYFGWIAVVDYFLFVGDESDSQLDQEIFVFVSDYVVLYPVSYTHLTLPTIYSV